MLKQMQGLNWLYFDLNSYFATIEQQVDLSLRGKPLVVVPLLSCQHRVKTDTDFLYPPVKN